MNIKQLKKDLATIDGLLTKTIQKIEQLSNYQKRNLTVSGEKLSTDPRTQKNQVGTRTKTLRSLVRERRVLERKVIAIKDKIQNLKGEANGSRW